MYAKDGYLIKDYEYDYMNEVAITFEDWNHQNGFMAIDVEFNEYIIRYTDQTFWECKDCYDDNHELGKYTFGNQFIRKNNIPKTIEVFIFHPPEKNECGSRYFTFVFRINDKNELYIGGKRGLLK